MSKKYVDDVRNYANYFTKTFFFITRFSFQKTNMGGCIGFQTQPAVSTPRREILHATMEDPTPQEILSSRSNTPTSSWGRLVTPPLLFNDLIDNELIISDAVIEPPILIPPPPPNNTYEIFNLPNSNEINIPNNNIPINQENILNDPRIIPVLHIILHYLGE